MDQSDKDLKVLRDVQERFASLLARTRLKTEGPNREELTQVTEQLLKSLDAEVAALEKARKLTLYQQEPEEDEVLYLSSEEGDRQAEETALLNLGAAVVVEWKKLPADVRHQLQQAASKGPFPQTPTTGLWETIRDVLHRNGTLRD
jgi:hypothetical protein